MQVPICILNVFEESKKEYSEASKGQTIYIVSGHAFSDKKVAQKFHKVASTQNAYGGGYGIGDIKTVKLDAISEAELDADILREETAMKKAKTADAKAKADKSSKQVAAKK